jgi:hypothetical protein
MAGIGEAASIIAVIDLAAKVGSLCFQYSREVVGARKDIANLQGQLGSLQDILGKVQQLLQKPDSARFSALPTISCALDDCVDQLKVLQKRLDPGKTRKILSRSGFRALKWPFESKDVENIVTRLERYKQTISLAFQVDQTYAIHPGRIESHRLTIFITTGR